MSKRSKAVDDSSGRGIAHDQHPNSVRRNILLSTSMLPLLGVLRTASANGTGEIAGYEPQSQPSKATLQKWLQQLHDFGPIRATGTKQCRDFEEWLANQFTELGFSLERDRYRLTSWECDIKDCAVSIKEASGAARDLEVIAYYPFAASTVASGPITGQVLYAGVSKPGVEKIIASTDAAMLTNAIVVVDMP